MLNEINIPETFHHAELGGVINQFELVLSAAKRVPGEVVFNFTRTNKISTIGVLLITAMADAFSGIKCKCVARYGEKKNISIVLRMFGATQGTIDGSLKDYLESHRVAIQRCFNAKESLAAVNKKLIPIIRAQYNPSENTLKAVNWALWETVDNAGLHGYKADPDFKASYPQPVYFCAYAFDDSIEIAILDLGQGIMNSFRSSGKEKYKNVDNEDALRCAIQKGESGSPKGSPGLGLFGCAELARQSKGKLVIMSGANMLNLQNGEVSLRTCYNFNGTMITLRLPKNMTISLSSVFPVDHGIVTDTFDELFGDFNDE